MTSVDNGGSVPCPSCGIGRAPNPSGKCQDCAVQAVREWAARDHPPEKKQKTARRKAQPVEQNNEPTRRLL